MEKRIRKCKEIDKNLSVLDKGMFNCMSHKPFDSSTYNAIHLALENNGVTDFEQPRMLVDVIFHVERRRINFKETMIGYCNITLLLETYNPYYISNSENENSGNSGNENSENGDEHFFERPNVKRFFKGDDARLFKLIKKKLSGTTKEKIEIFRKEQKAIETIFEEHKFPVLFIFNDMEKTYLKLRKDKMRFLPPIKELLINDTLFLCNYIHAGVENIHSPETVHIPSNMKFYRIMASDYGSPACMSVEWFKEYKLKLKKYLEKIPKNSENEKFIKRVIPSLLKKTNKFMTIAKTEKSKYPDPKYEHLTRRYLKSGHHLHYFNDSELINKIYGIELLTKEPSSIFRLSIINLFDYDVNLVDYLDLPESEIFPKIVFHTNDIIDILKKEGIKFVLYNDFSCSVSLDNVDPNAYNNVSNALKERARAIEGKSITEQMTNYLNSPYQTLPVKQKSVRSAPSGRKSRRLPSRNLPRSI
jgi:hypothetical protein